MTFRNEKLEAEAKAGMERFEEITKRWDQASNREVPQDLHDLLMQQKGLCDAMIDEKNKLINDFQLVRLSPTEMDFFLFFLVQPPLLMSR